AFSDGSGMSGKRDGKSGRFHGTPDPGGGGAGTNGRGDVPGNRVSYSGKRNRRRIRQFCGEIRAGKPSDSFGNDRVRRNGKKGQVTGMILLYTLKILTDLSFYYAFAGFAAEYVGGGIRILWILVLCLDFGIAVKHWNVRGVRLLGIFLAFLPLLFGTSADRILILPAVMYVAAELWKKDDSLY